MFDLLLCFLVIAYLSWAYLKWSTKRYNEVIVHIEKIPGPKTWPLFGNILQLGFKPTDYFQTLLLWTRTYNHNIFRMWAGPIPYVMFQHPKHVEHILSSNTLTYKHDPYYLMYPWLGNGLLTSNMPTWAVRRKMITPSFHFRILKDFLQIINETTDRFMLLLDQFAETEEIIDFQKIVTRSTVDVICETAMGTHVNSIAGPPSPIVQAIDDICATISERAFSVLKRFSFFFRFSPLYYVQAKALHILRTELAKIIEHRRTIIASANYNLLNDDDVKRPKMAFLDNLLTAEIYGRPLSFQEIFEEVSTFMFEGHDTTASALTFAAYCLSRHPEVQQIAYAEQFNVYGTDRRRTPSHQELLDMKYLEQVIKEVLRLFPSVPFIFRTAKDSLVIEEHFIPKGTTMGLPLIAIGHDPVRFEHPHEFNPDRFAADQRHQASPFDLVPFSAGPRNCIGQKFAMLELKVTISKLVRNFVILPPKEGLSKGIFDIFHPSGGSKPYELKLIVPITLKSINGVHLRLKRRA